MEPIVRSLVFLIVGAVVGAGGAVALRPSPPAPAPVREPVRDVAPAEDRDDELAAANASLVRSLQACNRKLGELGARQVEAPAPSAAPAASDPRDRRDRRRGPPSAEDWARFAEEGVVPYRVPCLRDTPYTPGARDLERMGLAPDDAEALKQAHARSNERMAAQIKPLCGATVGGADVAERIGPSACLKAILDASRRSSPDKMRDALTRVAEVNAGKRSAPDAREQPEAVESLLLALTGESQKFEADLAASFGPEEARRIVSLRGGCTEQGMASASLDGPRRGGRGGGGRP